MKWYIPGIRAINSWSTDIEPDHYVVAFEVPIAVGYSYNDYWVANGMKTSLTTARTFQTIYSWTPGSLKVYLGGTLVSPESISWNPPTCRFTLSGSLSNDYLWVVYQIYSVSYAATRTLPPATVGVLFELATPRVDSSTLLVIRNAVNEIEEELGLLPTRWVGGVDNMLLGEADTLYNGITPILAEHIRGIQDAISRIEEVVDRRLTQFPYTRTVFSQLDDTGVITIDHIRELTGAIERLYVEGGGVIG